MGEINSCTCGDLPKVNSKARRGAVTVLSGCMFSGKTTELLRQLASVRSGAALAFKHVIDDRYSHNAIVSHSGKAQSAIAVSSSRRIIEHLGPAVELIGIDDAHFFDAELGEIVKRLAARGIHVIAACLNPDSWGRPFPLCEELYAIADQAVTKYAQCGRCGAAADRTQRLTPIIDGRLVGGPESYEPRCQSCWHPPPQSPPD